MISSIKKITAVLLLVSVLTACNQGPTLQTYFVDKELSPGFIAADLPKTLIDITKVSTTKAQQEAYNSVDKLNVLAFSLDEDNAQVYDTELAVVTSILEDSKYQELVRGGNSADGTFVVKFIGEVNAINELIIFINAKDRGFLIARVLGDAMNAGQLMSLQNILKDANYNETRFENFTEFFI